VRATLDGFRRSISASWQAEGGDVQRAERASNRVERHAIFGLVALAESGG
jgi:hypothetical protein